VLRERRGRRVLSSRGRFEKGSKKRFFVMFVVERPRPMRGFSPIH
jgi:hypothetical protein